MIGADADAIDKAEIASAFARPWTRSGWNRRAQAWPIRSKKRSRSLTTGPSIIRPSFTLGGTGGRLPTTRPEFEHIVKLASNASPTTEVLIEEACSVEGVQMEVVRDRADNAIIICSIENVIRWASIPETRSRSLRR